MNNRENTFAAIVVVVLVLLTAWGNAAAMFLVAAAGMLVGIVWFRGKDFRSAARVGLAGCAIGGIIACLLR